MIFLWQESLLLSVELSASFRREIRSSYLKLHVKMYVAATGSAQHQAASVQATITHNFT